MLEALGLNRRLPLRVPATAAWGLRPPAVFSFTTATAGKAASRSRGTMTNVSNELVWSLVRKNNCFLHKRNGQTKR